MFRISAALVLVGLALLLLSLAPLDGSAPPPAALDQVAYGQALFAAKGCASCHIHAAVRRTHTSEVGPNLTHYHNDPAFLQRWLTSPAATKPGATMPTLGLREEEIAALIAFLNQNNTP